MDSCKQELRVFVQTAAKQRTHTSACACFFLLCCPLALESNRADVHKNVFAHSTQSVAFVQKKMHRRYLDRFPARFIDIIFVQNIAKLKVHMQANKVRNTYVRGFFLYNSNELIGKSASLDWSRLRVVVDIFLPACFRTWPFLLFFIRFRSRLRSIFGSYLCHRYRCIILKPISPKRCLIKNVFDIRQIIC